MTRAIPSKPDFRSSVFLRAHVEWLIDFYYPRAIDPRGGYFHFYALDGSEIDKDRRSLVSSARMVVMFAMASRLLGRPELATAAAHGFRFLQEAHRDPAFGGYAWELVFDGKRFVATDASNQAYGFAHVGLAFAHAAAVGVDGAGNALAALFDLMDQRMLDSPHPLYREEFAADFQPLSDYRGQNSNMHACEAWIAAYRATREPRYLSRAVAIAEALCVEGATSTHGLVYEHYAPDWRPDIDYNRGDFSNIFRPWGFQPGHQTEWAKFLVVLAELADRPDLALRGKDMFDRSMDLAFDEIHGGLVYGLDPDLRVANADKYFWVQIESAVAAMRLARYFGEPSYAGWHDRFWDLCWVHFIDHIHGSWNIAMTGNFELKSLDKGFGGKDYHPLGACFDLAYTAEHRD